MSQEQLKAFLAAVQTDSSLQAKLQASGADTVAIANAAGYDVTADDFRTAKEELSLAELEGVAGGLASNCGTWQGKVLTCTDL
jgi:predicted ribosomally synthesized peptide with nif11-like leader